ncbi:membrane protein [Staphylococcus aureus]|nr:membrane protein [Staphylococcus aureus]
MILVMLSPLLIIFFIVLSILEERKRTKKKQLEKEKANTLNQNTNDTERSNQEPSLQQTKEQKDNKG